MSELRTADSAAERANQRNALLAGFLGWTLDAFDFFVLTYVLNDVAKSFHRTRPDIALTLTASLAMRPVGALIFGLLADRYGRRLPLMLDVVFYSVMEVFSGLAPSYRTFMILRLLYGIGMGRRCIADDGVGPGTLARDCFRAAAGGLRTRKHPGCGRLFHDFSAFRMASVVLGRRTACAVVSIHPSQSEGIFGLARDAYGLEQ